MKLFSQQLEHHRSTSCICNRVELTTSVFHLSIDDEYQGPGSSEDHLIVKGGVKEVDLAGEVPDLEVDERAAGDVVFVDLVGTLQEQGLIGRHFVENHLKSELCSSLKQNEFRLTVSSDSENET